MESITLLSGLAKDGTHENFDPLLLKPGEMYAIVGNTGSGKSRLIKDVEQLVSGDSVTGRTVLLDGKVIPPEERIKISGGLVAHLEQTMRFVLDVTVSEFIDLHCQCRHKTNVSMEEVLDAANSITQEPIIPDQHLNLLSGGQSRALMIADIALICDSPIVLIDEIENAGVNKTKALELLTGKDKLVLMVTHDPHTALMATKRIVLKNGAVEALLERSAQETEIFSRLEKNYHEHVKLQHLMRKGVHLENSNLILE